MLGCLFHPIGFPQGPSQVNFTPHSAGRKKLPPHVVRNGSFLHVRGRGGKLTCDGPGRYIECFGLEHAQETMHKQRGQSGTDKRSDARNK